MARAVYSTRFLASSGTGTQEPTYTVPDGFVAVIRDIDGIVPDIAGSVVQCGLVDPQALFVDENYASNGGKHVQWQGRQVAYAGEQLAGLIIGAAFGSLCASGYLLTV